MEIKLTSREIVKPSKPTPEDRRTFNLSAFDLLHRNTYFPLILFYPQTTNPNNVSSQLKKSLSETLAIFYPLAGRRNDAVSVSCNDEGAIYLEATVNASIAEFLTPPKLDSLNRLLPCEPYKLLRRPPQEEKGEEEGDGGDGGEAVSPSSLPNLLVQVSRFKCGGISIGVCNLHAVMDACSSSVVLKAWSAICREERDEMTWPDFESSFAVFPPRDVSGMRAGLLSVSTKIEAKCHIRRFVFTREAITTLRSEAKDSDNDELWKPTRYEVLSSFIAKHMILSHGPSAAVVVHIVDVRRRMGRPLCPSSMGNLLWPAMVPYDAVATTMNLKDLVRATKGSMEKMKRELFLRMQRDPEFLRSEECGELLLEGMKKEKVVVLVMTSWGNVGFEELDFGWGRAVWVGFRGGTQHCVPNSVVMIETKEGMEAWVSMEEQHMALLETDAQFRRFALLNPNVDLGLAGKS